MFVAFGLIVILSTLYDLLKKGDVLRYWDKIVRISLKHLTRLKIIFKLLSQQFRLQIIRKGDISGQANLQYSLKKSLQGIHYYKSLHKIPLFLCFLLFLFLSVIRWSQPNFQMYNAICVYCCFVTSQSFNAKFNYYAVP